MRRNGIADALYVESEEDPNCNSSLRTTASGGQTLTLLPFPKSILLYSAMDVFILALFYSVNMAVGTEKQAFANYLK